MTQRRLFCLAICLTAALATGCTTLADARLAQGTGTAREYAAPVDRVWTALPSVLAALSLPLVSENKAEGTILAQRGVTAFSYGENVAIFVKPGSSAGSTQVEVVSKKAMATNLFAPDWARDIHDKLGQKLK